MYIVMCLRLISFHIDLKSTHFNYTHDVANLETHGRLIRIIVLINTIVAKALDGQRYPLPLSECMRV